MDMGREDGSLVILINRPKCEAVVLACGWGLVSPCLVDGLDDTCRVDEIGNTDKQRPIRREKDLDCGVDHRWHIRM